MSGRWRWRLELDLKVVMTAAGAHRQDGECLDATSSVHYRVLLTVTALYANSSTRLGTGNHFNPERGLVQTRRSTGNVLQSYQNIASTSCFSVLLHERGMRIVFSGALLDRTAKYSFGDNSNLFKVRFEPQRLFSAYQSSTTSPWFETMSYRDTNK